MKGAIKVFSPPHLAALAFSAWLTAFLCRKSAEMSRENLDRMLKAFAVMAVLFDPIYWIWEIKTFGHIKLATTLPLYLCSIYWIMMPFAVFSKKSRLRQTAQAAVCTLGLIGGVLGLVLNVYINRFGFFHFVPIRSMLYHLLMVVSAAVMWYSGYYKPQKRDRTACFAPVIPMLFISLILNRLYGWDYCYTAGGPGTPLELVSRRMPQPIFLMLFYGVLLLFIQLVFYRRFMPAFNRETVQSEKHPPLTAK